jgi:hypothetical protein
MTDPCVGPAGTTNARMDSRQLRRRAEMSDG